MEIVLYLKNKNEKTSSLDSFTAADSTPVCGFEGLNLMMTSLSYRGNISSIFSTNSEDKASALLSELFHPFYISVYVMNT